MWERVQYLARALLTCLLFDAALFWLFLWTVSPLIRRDEILCCQRSTLRFLSHLIRLRVVTSVLGLISGKADKFVFLFHLLGLAPTSCSWLQISVVINNSNSPVDFPNLLVEFSYACLSGMIACNRDHVKSYYFYYKLSFSPWIQITFPFHI